MDRDREERRRRREEWRKRQPPEDAVRAAFVSQDLQRMLDVRDVPSHPLNRHALLVSLAQMVYPNRAIGDGRATLHELCEKYVAEWPAIAPALKQDSIDSFGRVVGSVPVFAMYGRSLLEAGRLNDALRVVDFGLAEWPEPGTSNELNGVRGRIVKALEKERP